VSLAPSQTCNDPSRLAAVLAAVERDLAPHCSRIVDTSMVDCGVRTREEGLEAFHGFLQWFSAISSLPEERHFVMLRGSVDQLWHALILHTKLYRSICERHLGHYLDHSPKAGYPPQEWIRETVEWLWLGYGENLSPFLAAWSPSTVSKLRVRQVRGVDGRPLGPGCHWLSLRS
jgi:hypothetical protein